MCTGYSSSVHHKLANDLPHAIIVLKADSSILTAPSSPTRNIVFTDSNGYYDIISQSFSSSPTCISNSTNFNWEQLLANVDLTSIQPVQLYFLFYRSSFIYLYILYLWSLEDNSQFCINTFNTLVGVARSLIRSTVRYDD